MYLEVPNTGEVASTLLSRNPVRDTFTTMASDSDIQPPDMRLLPNQQCFLLTSPLTYTWTAPEGTYEGRRLQLTVPEGFEHDFASVPHLLHSLINPIDLGLASIVHDWLYHRKGHVITRVQEDGKWTEIETPWTRKMADRLWARIMREQDVVRWRRRLAYQIVRLPFVGGILWAEGPDPEPSDG